MRLRRLDTHYFLGGEEMENIINRPRGLVAYFLLRVVREKDGGFFWLFLGSKCVEPYNG